VINYEGRGFDTFLPHNKDLYLALMNNTHINSIQISISLEKYRDKNRIDWKFVKYEQQEISVEEFASLIQQGHCFCHCFKTKGNVFGLSEKTDANFIRADMVFVDVDDSDIEMNEFVSHLCKAPTSYYTTPNNHTEKSNYKYRFRLCYQFNTPITDADTYKAMYMGIMKSISNDIGGFVNKDNCGQKASQQFAGNGSGNCELYTTSNVFSFNDFPFQNNNASLSSSLLFSNGKTKKETTHAQNEVEIADKEFMNDVLKLKPMELIDKYRNRYRYFTHTELEFSNGYALIPSDYQEIYRAWRTESFTKSNGDTINIQAVKKLRDGDGRKKKLFIAGLIMKKIFPTITYEHLLFNLLCERYYYYDNLDGELNVKRMMEIAKNVIYKPIDKISLNSREKRKFVVDKSYCAEHGITANQMKNIVRKQLNDEEIGCLYDSSMSLADNLEVLKSIGVKVGKSKLYQWCKENNINPKGERKTINLQKTLKELQKITREYFFAACLQVKHSLLKRANEIRELINNTPHAA